MYIKAYMGPMKSGKTEAAITIAHEYEAQDLRVACIQPLKNERDQQMSSRCGLAKDAIKIPKLAEIVNIDADVCIIDEFHMFQPEDIEQALPRLAGQGVMTLVFGLDLDYRGVDLPSAKVVNNIVTVPTEYLTARCEQLVLSQEACDKDAAYTQIIDGSVPVTGGLKPVTSEIRNLNYTPRCDNHFIRAQQTSRVNSLVQHL